MIFLYIFLLYSWYSYDIPCLDQKKTQDSKAALEEVVDPEDPGRVAVCKEYQSMPGESIGWSNILQPGGIG